MSSSVIAETANATSVSALRVWPPGVGGGLAGRNRTGHGAFASASGFGRMSWPIYRSSIKVSRLVTTACRSIFFLLVCIFACFDPRSCVLALPIPGSNPRDAWFSHLRWLIWDLGGNIACRPAIYEHTAVDSDLVLIISIICLDLIYYTNRIVRVHAVSKMIFGGHYIGVD
jgi:hypothetical protein